MNIQKRAYQKWALFFLCLLTACSQKFTPQTDVTPPQHSYQTAKTISFSVTPKKLDAEEIAIQKLLLAAKKRKEQQDQAKKTAAAFHYRIASNIFKGLVQNNNNLTQNPGDLNRARKHLVQSLEFCKSHKEAWKLLNKIDSYLGQPRGCEETLLEKAAQNRQNEASQKQIETQIKLQKAENLIDAGQYEKALQELEKLQRKSTE